MPTIRVDNFRWMDHDRDRRGPDNGLRAATAPRCGAHDGSRGPIGLDRSVIRRIPGGKQIQRRRSQVWQSPVDPNRPSPAGRDGNGQPQGHPLVAVL